MKLSIKASVLALAVALSSSAFAGTYTASSAIGASGYSFTANTPLDGADFTDTFNFLLAAGSGSSVKFDVGYRDYGNGYFSLPTMTFTIGSVTKTVDFSATPTGNGFISSTVVFSGLSQSTPYSLEVKGINADGYGSYNLGSTYNVTVAAVPEPETYAMFLAGLGIMGAVARRRAKNA